MTQIQYYETELGLLVKLNLNYTFSPETQRINDKELSSTFNPSWWIVKDEVEFKTISRALGKKAVNKRYVLVNTDVKGVPEIIMDTDIERDEEYDWAGKYAGLRTLYEEKYELEDMGFEEYKLDHVINLGKLKFKNLGDPTKFSFTVCGERYSDNKREVLDYKKLFLGFGWGEGISIDEIAKSMVPDIAWHLYPCSFSSQQTYRIIRAWVKDHIDSQYAEITSDYDFCFTVKKRVRIKPYNYRSESLDSTRRRPKFVNRHVEYKTVEIFEMTHAKERYKGYTVIEGFKGNSLEDLAENVDSYLKELMQIINEPISECPKCKGIGTLDIKVLSPNERRDLALKEPIAKVI